MAFLPFLIVLAVGYLLIWVGGKWAYTRYADGEGRSGTAVVALLAIGLIFTGLTGSWYVNEDAEHVDYRVQECDDVSKTVMTPPDDSTSLQTTPIPPDEATAFSDLSPEGQDVFLWTLRSADMKYDTKIRPDEFELRVSDEGGVSENIITYNATCYVLTGEPRRNFGTGYGIVFFYTVAGSGLVLLLSLIAAATIRRVAGE